jgi:hypothetical protein
MDMPLKEGARRPRTEVGGSGLHVQRGVGLRHSLCVMDSTPVSGRNGTLKYSICSCISTFAELFLGVESRDSTCCNADYSTYM